MSNPVPPVQAAPAKAEGPSAPSRDGDAPPNAFAAMLGVAKAAESPPATPATARTAHAEGSKAEGDSSGHHCKSVPAAPAPAPAPTAATAAAAAVTPPVAAVPQPVPATASPAASGGKGRRLPGRVPAVAQPVSVEGTAPAAGGRTIQPATGQQAVPLTAATAHATTPATGAETIALGEGRPSAAAPVTRDEDTAASTAAAAKRGGHRTLPPRGDVADHSPMAAQTLSAHNPRALGKRGHVHRMATQVAPDTTPIKDRPAPTATDAPVRSSNGTAGTAPGSGSAAAGEAAHARVRTHELAESMHTLVRVATRRGSAAARITLRPAELGGVQVRLRAHQGGVSASLTAETPAGAQALGAAHGELRRSLESQGILVHAIEVQLAGDGLGADSQSRQWQSQAAAAQAALLPDDDTESETTIEPSLLPDAGGQVDVLA